MFFILNNEADCQCNALHRLKRSRYCQTPWDGLISVTTGVLSSDHSKPQSPEQRDEIPLINTSTCKQHYTLGIQSHVIQLYNSYPFVFICNLLSDLLSKSNKLISYNHIIRYDCCTCGLDSQTRRRSPAILRINNPPFFFSLAETTMFVPPNTDESLTCNEEDLNYVADLFAFIPKTVISAAETYNLWKPKNRFSPQVMTFCAFFYQNKELDFREKKRTFLSYYIICSVTEC